jgi:hypothetical protein
MPTSARPIPETQTSRFEQIPISTAEMLKTHPDHGSHGCHGDSLVVESQPMNRPHQGFLGGFDLDKMSLISPAPHTISASGLSTYCGW